MGQGINVIKSLMRVSIKMRQWNCTRDVKAKVSRLRDKNLKQRDGHNNALFDKGSC